MLKRGIGMKVESYLFFKGCCEEAVGFYQKALGAKVEELMRYKDSPEPMEGSSPEKVMHVSLVIGQTRVMMADDCCSGNSNTKFDGFSLTITAANGVEAEKIFAALGEGGQVCMPLAATFFAAKFGMLRDKFGVTWMVLVDK